MDTKTCEKCGWVLPMRHPANHCPICKTWFKEGICTKCGKPVTFYRYGKRTCKECYDKYVRTPRDNQAMQQRRVDFYNEWVEKISKIPKDYPTLTEDQWMEAVKHFNGCALCKSDDVDTRGYFIPFKNGGRYCDWNIIPVCDKCATEIRLNPNYFKNRRPAGLMDIVDYLEVRIDAALARSKK